jgi:hypothetical protein
MRLLIIRLSWAYRLYGFLRVEATVRLRHIGQPFYRLRHQAG